MNNKIILASASPRRREILEQIGAEFEVIPSDVEENVKSNVPSEMAMELSAMKAMDVFERLSCEKRRSAIVVGADTVVALGEGDALSGSAGAASGNAADRKVMGKPKDRKEAEEMLSLLQGRTHQVYTGVTLVWQEKEGQGARQVSFYERTDVAMYPMEEEEIRAYVDTGEPLDKAGAYGIQGKCAPYIRGISGDYYNVVGLPVGRLCQEMKKICFD